MDHDEDSEADSEADSNEVMEPGLWKKNGWTARVLKNEDDDGWAVAMTRDGDPDPALVGPWTMGRDKRNPKPLDAYAFSTLVKTASEVIRRHEQSMRERLHRALSFVAEDGARLHATLDIAPDDDDPHAMLKVVDEQTDEVRCNSRVSAGFKLSAALVQRYLKSGEG